MKITDSRVNKSYQKQFSPTNIWRLSSLSQGIISTWNRSRSSSHNCHQKHKPTILSVKKFLASKVPKVCVCFKRSSLLLQIQVAQKPLIISSASRNCSQYLFLKLNSQVKTVKVLVILTIQQWWKQTETSSTQLIEIRYSQRGIQLKD